MIAESPRTVVQLLDREVPEDYLREWTAHVAAKKDTSEQGTKSVVVFRIGVEWLALPTEVFHEIAESCKVHKLPRGRGGILGGLVNVRGELLVCVDLEALLGLDNATGAGAIQRGACSRLLVCNCKGGRLTFPVNEVYGVHRYHPRDLRSVPVTLAKTTRGSYAAGILPWKNRTIGCLDHEVLFDALNKVLK
jgi:chemotaxis-related protein WspD